ncbi:MAG: hypothetical protein Q4615_03560 [Paracoccus aminovorans]|nr:hypothetical protein [Paracoccus aminovorans]
MLDGAALLDLYQHGRAGDAAGRLALLARAAGADAATQPLAELDRRIWALRADWLGAAAGEAVCTCPDCGGRLEFTLPAGFALPEPILESVQVARQGRSHLLRQPRLADIGPGGLDPRRLGDGPRHEPGFAAAAGRALQAADPALGLAFAMTCPDCGAALEQVFDPAGYFWAEIEALARRLLHEVALLARAFGWSEAEILALSPGRRALYLAEVAP